MIAGIVSTVGIRFSANCRIAGGVTVGESTIYLHGTPDEVRSFARAVLAEADDMELRAAREAGKEA